MVVFMAMVGGGVVGHFHGRIMLGEKEKEIGSLRGAMRLLVD